MMKLPRFAAALTLALLAFALLLAGAGAGAGTMGTMTTGLAPAPAAAQGNDPYVPPGGDYDLDDDGLIESAPWRSSTPSAGTPAAPGLYRPLRLATIFTPPSPAPSRRFSTRPALLTPSRPSAARLALTRRPRGASPAGATATNWLTTWTLTPTTTAASRRPTATCPGAPAPGPARAGIPSPLSPATFRATATSSRI